MGNGDDRITFPELRYEFLDTRRGRHVQRRCGLVQKKDCRLQGKSPGQTEALLLAPRKMGSVRVQPVPDLLPEPRAPERFFRGCGDLPFRHPPHRFQRYRDIAVYADRQHVRSLKDHSHKAPQFTDRAFAPVNVFHASPEVDFHAPRRSAAWKCLVQPVQRPQERCFARTGPACEHGDAPRGRFQGNAVQDFRFPESDMEIADAAG